MSEYTPTTEGVRETYAQSLYWRGRVSSERMQQFDRWLAAHDAEVRQEQADHDAVRINDLDTRLVTAERELAEVRAGVVAEEPEWEYGVSYSTPSGPSIDGYRIRSYMKVESVEKAQEFAALVQRPVIQKRTKAVPAGEWVSVPVKQEGAE